MISKLFAGAVLAGALIIPSLALAQSSTSGLLKVYVQVINSTGYSYGPGYFTVAVSGQNPSISTFQGSQSGTYVTLTPGDYSVVVTNLPSNVTANYSTGCDKYINANETQTCVITMNASAYTSGTITHYPYGSQTPPLTCRTETPTVALGQAARFTAIGGAGGTYNWATAYQNYPNVGPVLTTSFQASGSQIVTVTNAAQTATCAVTVTTGYTPVPTQYNSGYTTPTYNQYGTPSYNQYGTPAVSYSAVAYPRFPNTGFEPLTSAQMAFALVLIMGTAIASYPYARKAFAIAVR